LSELYGYSTPLTTFLKIFGFVGHCMIFLPTVNSRASDNGSKWCQNCISQLGKMCRYEMSACISVFVEGVNSGS
jgi:hypothetical protein